MSFHFIACFIIYLSAGYSCYWYTMRSLMKMNLVRPCIIYEISLVFNKSRPVLVSCRLLQKGCLNQNRRLLIYIYPKVCTRSLHMLFSWCYWYNDMCLHCSQMLYLIPCSLSGANWKVCYLSPFIWCFQNQIRKGPSFLMSLFCCRATWH